MSSDTDPGSSPPTPRHASPGPGWPDVRGPLDASAAHGLGDVADANAEDGAEDGADYVGDADYADEPGDADETNSADEPDNAYEPDNAFEPDADDEPFIP